MRIDTGNRPFGYGNVTAVLAPAFWKDAVAPPGLKTRHRSAPRGLGAGGAGRSGRLLPSPASARQSATDRTNSIICK